MLRELPPGRGPLAMALAAMAMALVFTMAPTPCVADAGLTVQEATSRALAQPAVARLLRARVDGAAASSALAASWSPPTLDLGHEQLASGPGSDEQSLVLSQTLDLSGSRSLLRQAGQAKVAAAKARGQHWRIGLVASVQRRFYTALYLQLRAAALAGWSARLADALVLMNKRIAAGESSRYDRQRLQREQRAARAAAALNGANLAAALARLAGAMGGAGGADVGSLKGALLPEGPPPLVDAAAIVHKRPDLLALAHAAKAAALQGRAGNKRWLRSLQLRGGYLTAGGTERQHGFVLGLSAALPFAGRAGLRQQAANARRETLVSQRALELQRQTAEIDALARLSRRLHGAASELRVSAAPAREAMLKTAMASWRGGVLGLLDLLDAQRSATEEALQVLDLEHHARLAAINLNAASEGSQQ